MKYNDAYVSKVFEAVDDNGIPFCEQVEDDYIPPSGERCYYSVYLHLIEGGCECVGDYNTKAYAQSICDILEAGIKALTPKEKASK